MTDKEKVLTPITDRAAFFADAKLGKTVFVVLHKDARELEEMCEELASALEACYEHWIPDDQQQPALARYQAMKEKAK